jgi:predicted Fe-Mo cluster-binding NifX family protein
VFEHFGSAPYFTLYDSANDEVKVVQNRNSHHSHGTCHPMAQLARHKIDCVVCSGMGMRAINALNAEGVKVYQAASGTVGEVIGKIKGGDLPEMDPRTACRGHGQTGGCGHGQAAVEDRDHGRQRGAGHGQGGRKGRGRGRDA